MGSLSFSKIASAILSSVSTGGTLHTTAATGTFLPTFTITSGGASGDSNLSQVCLKGKLDLSLWRDIGNDDDDDEEEEEMELLGKRSGGLGVISSTPPTAHSPILAPLLGTKSLKEKEAGGGCFIKRNSISPVSPPGTGFFSLGAAPPAVVVTVENQQQSHHHNRYENNNSGGVVRASTPTPLSKSLESSSSAANRHQEKKNKTSDYGKKRIGGAQGVTPSSSTPYWSDDGGAVDGPTARHVSSQQSAEEAGGAAGRLSLLRQQKLLPGIATVATGSSITREQEGSKPQVGGSSNGGVEAKLLPFLSAFIGSSQLSRGSQFQSRGGGESRTNLRSGRKVEFPAEEERGVMEQQEKQAVGMAGTEQGTGGTSGVEKSGKGDKLRVKRAI